MVLTPDLSPNRPISGPLSPLLLASHGSPFIPPHPTPRRSSTGNFSQLSDFHLDPQEDDNGNGVSGVGHVDLTINYTQVETTV